MYRTWQLKVRGPGDLFTNWNISNIVPGMAGMYLYQLIDAYGQVQYRRWGGLASVGNCVLQFQDAGLGDGEYTSQLKIFGARPFLDRVVVNADWRLGAPDPRWQDPTKLPDMPDVPSMSVGALAGALLAGLAFLFFFVFRR